MLPYIHFMVKYSNKNFLGWITPQECPENSYCGYYVAPTNKNGNFYKQYIIDFAKYIGQGKRGPIETTNVIVKPFERSYLFILQIENQTITFQEYSNNIESNRLKYIGNYLYPDFPSKFLVEIKPTPTNILDKLFEKTGYILIGSYRK